MRRHGEGGHLSTSQGERSQNKPTLPTPSPQNLASNCAAVNSVASAAQVVAVCYGSPSKLGRPPGWLPLCLPGPL